MWEDPIVKEVHETRARILARFDGDFHAYVRYIQACEAEDKQNGLRYVSPGRLDTNGADADSKSNAA